MSTKISCCYHPTSVVFVDDNKSFLENVLLDFDESMSACFFTDPVEAVKYLRSHTLFSFSNRYLKNLQDIENSEGLLCGNVEHGYVDIDVFGIHKEIYNPNRFDTVIVVIVDYTMPGMNGIELCKSLQGLPLKFVLITGDATLDTAIDAFNKGIIHQFVSKSSSNFIQELQRVVYDLQARQFEESSGVVVCNLTANRPTALVDPKLISFLKEFFKANDVVEYYLINESGCFLLVNSHGELNYLVVKNEEEMEKYTEIAADCYGKDEVVEGLRSRKKILFLLTEKEHVLVDVDDWGMYLYPATKLIGENNTYYYSYVKKTASEDFLKDNIISYENFLDTR